MTSWLSKQKKQTLLELSAEAGLKQDDDTRKDELIDNLDKHLQANSTRLSRNSSFQPYFDTRRTPFKARSSSAGGITSGDDAESKSVVKARGRRTTKVKQEVEDEDPANVSPSQALVPSSSAITPARRRSQLLPPSPADVADDVEVAARRFSSGVHEMWNKTGITEMTEHLRERCSSLLALQATILALEAYGLQAAILPRRRAFDIPAFKLGPLTTPAIPIGISDLFQLLTAEFWKTSILWSSTSIFLPLLVSFLYNLSKHDVRRHGHRETVARYSFDPFMYNVSKAILTYAVYGQGFTFGIVNPGSIIAVNLAMVGGYNGIMIGSYVGILAAIYEAAQSK